jgi:hypothetical protein
MTIIRYPGETDAELRKRIFEVEDLKNRGKLKQFLGKLGLKSAKSNGIRVNFAGMNVRVPGSYSRVVVKK